jgi:hypothetical protein
MSRSPRRLTDAERAERRRRDRERLADALRGLLSSEGWRAWLRARATFHSKAFTSRELVVEAVIFWLDFDRSQLATWQSVVTGVTHVFSDQLLQCRLPCSQHGGCQPRREAGEPRRHLHPSRRPSRPCGPSDPAQQPA